MKLSQDLDDDPNGHRRPDVSGPRGSSSVPLPNAETDDEWRHIATITSPDLTSNALDRLASSRQSLRSALLDIAHPPKQPSLFSSGSANIGNRLMARARAVPGIALAIDSARSWWEAHPLHTAATVVAATSGPVLAPIARRNPKGVLLTAFGLGAVLVLIKPWRILLRPSVLISTVLQIVSHTANR